ncbi:hypothetical protein BESB_070980 [Besnoitia besnoiti]|uniref:Uncharacterized protein n=1 Tax=Besnoitia besnoiti TaxID=94643 RepID=A0A2A9MDB5_BESBE|nr:uncharacterized protein BESB_070980 [Besnoitia besnoiti]PFH33946.1 hypothetical protein BESB_070980 [Besnoitia besnoiti]
MADNAWQHTSPGGGSPTMLRSPSAGGHTSDAALHPYASTHSASSNASLCSDRGQPVYVSSTSAVFPASSHASGTASEADVCYRAPALSCGPVGMPIPSCVRPGIASPPTSPPPTAVDVNPMIPSKFKYSFPRNKIPRHRSYEVLVIEEDPQAICLSRCGRLVVNQDEALNKIKKPHTKKSIFGIAKKSGTNLSDAPGTVHPSSKLSMSPAQNLSLARAGTTSVPSAARDLEGTKPAGEAPKKQKGWMRNFQCFLCTSPDYLTTEQAALEEQKEQLDEAITEFQETNRVQVIRLFETEKRLAQEHEAREQLQLQLEYETSELKKKNSQLEKETKLAEKSMNELREKVVKTIETVYTIRESADTSELDAVLRGFCSEVAGVLNEAQESGMRGPTIIIPQPPPLRRPLPQEVSDSPAYPPAGSRETSPGLATPGERVEPEEPVLAKKKTVKKKKVTKEGKKVTIKKKAATGKKGTKKAAGAKKGAAKGVKGQKTGLKRGAAGAKKKGSPKKKTGKAVTRRAKGVTKNVKKSVQAAGAAVPIALRYAEGLAGKTSPQAHLQQQLLEMQQNGQLSSQAGVCTAARANGGLQFLLYPGFLEQPSKPLKATGSTEGVAGTAGAQDDLLKRLPSDPNLLANLIIEKQLGA